MSTTQVAVRCNDQLLRDLDWLVVRCDYENRAEAIRAALRQVIDAERRREIGEQIAEGYRRTPQTEEELEIVDSHWGFPGLPETEPWDDGNWEGWFGEAG